MQWTPHVTVATIVERAGRYLLVYEEADGKKVYNQPAGHLEAQESLQQAAVRETLEETGWEVRLTGIVGVNLYVAPANGITYLRTTFAAEVIHFQAEHPLDSGIIEAVWLTYEEILERREQLRSPMTLTVIEAYRRGKRFSLDLLAE